MELLKQALMERNALTEETTILRKRLAELPEGTLVINKSGNGPTGFKWFRREFDTKKGKYKKVYIPKKERGYAAGLAERAILSHRLTDATKKLAAINGLLRHYPTFSCADKLLSKSPGYRELLLPERIGRNDALAAWENYPYVQNTFKLERKNVRTIRGELVRSKAEAMIANTLYQRKIAYRYDCALQLGDETIYPDFILIRPGVMVPPPEHQLCEDDVNLILIIEHNGRMDDQKYLNRLKHKTGLYYDYGFMPSRNLIMTYETERMPFDLSYFIRELEYYFE